MIVNATAMWGPQSTWERISSVTASCSSPDDLAEIIRHLQAATRRRLAALGHVVGDEETIYAYLSPVTIAEGSVDEFQGILTRLRVDGDADRLEEKFSFPVVGTRRTGDPVTTAHRLLSSVVRLLVNEAGPARRTVDDVAVLTHPEYSRWLESLSHHTDYTLSGAVEGQLGRFDVPLDDFWDTLPPEREASFELELPGGPEMHEPESSETSWLVDALAPRGSPDLMDQEFRRFLQHQCDKGLLRNELTDGYAAQLMDDFLAGWMGSRGA